MSQKRRTFLRKVSAASIGLAGVSGTAVATKDPRKEAPITAVRQLLWKGKVKKAKKLMKNHDMENIMFKGVPQRENDGKFSTSRYGNPSEDSETHIYLSLTKISDGSPPVYDATCSFQISEWNNDFADQPLGVGSHDSAGISWATDYWQATNQSRDNVYFSDSRISYEEYERFGCRIEVNEPQTLTDGVDQTYNAGFSTEIEAINRDLYTGTYNVGGEYVHTYDDQDTEISWTFGPFTLDPANSGHPHWHMNASDEA